MSKIEVHYLNQEEPGHGKESREARRAKPCSVTKDGETVAAHLYESEALRVAGALSQPITAAEAVFGLFSWLTTCTELIECSAAHDAAPLGEMVKAFCEAHKLGDVTAAWPEGLERSPFANLDKHDTQEAAVEISEAVPGTSKLEAQLFGPLVELESVAEELDKVAQREDEALKILKENGVDVSNKNLNYPTEQREHAERIRGAIAVLRECGVRPVTNYGSNYSHPGKPSAFGELEAIAVDLEAVAQRGEIAAGLLDAGGLNSGAIGSALSPILWRTHASEIRKALATFDSTEDSDELPEHDSHDDVRCGWVGVGTCPVCGHESGRVGI